MLTVATGWLSSTTGGAPAAPLLLLLLTSASAAGAALDLLTCAVSQHQIMCALLTDSSMLTLVV
jgi:hypothetical protein